ncbi:MAG: cysteine desulfurase [Lachnospiraceae bacterium]|jgi:cysteine desulfurase|nr:cysteine desulfurase [Lachnospiraceae bacterium]MCI1397790.1 cysteine desulfurase [Lachnospiraceae bacterium]MCI1423004.1 cysteine desulfurase [Lachnospiraceae bacterium]MCI1451782.1 cysteine desulfurase [Lachnospiraceae bacterium]MDD5849169.1 cysteine desulfurase family protein [Bacillota bacterium]
MEREIYLDNSATTRCFPEVVSLMDRILLEEYGNPSSLHHKGVEAEREIRKAKEILADILKCSPRNLIFTSCGTESDNISLIGGALANQREGKHLITTKIEHPAILETCKYLASQGFEITYLPVDENGLVNPEDVKNAVREDTILVSVMHTNNEIGALEPIEEIGRVIKEKNPKTLFHVDAVQGFGKNVIHPKQMKIDLLSASGHKIHAPKGVGLLYIGDGVKVRNILFGGGQQGGMRSGTENVASIAGMALAAKMLYDHLDEDRDRLYEMKQRFLDRVTRIEGVHANGKTGRDSAPHVISLSIEGVRAEVLLHALEEKNIYVSAGSACSSNRPHISETLLAIGTPKEYLDSTLRFSTSVMNTDEDMDDAAAALEQLLPFLRKYTRQ